MLPVSVLMGDGHLTAPSLYQGSVSSCNDFLRALVLTTLILGAVVHHDRHTQDHLLAPDDSLVLLTNVHYYMY